MKKHLAVVGPGQTAAIEAAMTILREPGERPEAVSLTELNRLQAKADRTEDPVERERARSSLRVAQDRRRVWDALERVARQRGFAVTKRPAKCAVTGDVVTSGQGFTRKTGGGAWISYSAVVVKAAIVEGRELPLRVGP